MRKHLWSLILAATVSHAVIAGPPSSVPTCRPGGHRTPVKIWHPEFTAKGDLRSVPEIKDGDIVFIEFFRENADMDCAAGQADHLYSFSYPNNPKDPLGEGGLAVNVRGNVQFANSYCYVSGFFINQQVMGIHQGWTETYFGALDAAQVVLSGTACMSTSMRARRHR
jgi:hypothetical protein